MQIKCVEKELLITNFEYVVFLTSNHSNVFIYGMKLFYVAVSLDECGKYLHFKHEISM